MYAYTITGGTGRFSNATGSGTSRIVSNFSSGVPGTLTGTLDGPSALTISSGPAPRICRSVQHLVAERVASRDREFDQRHTHRRVQRGCRGHQR